jgi:hypothetical protein
MTDQRTATESLFIVKGSDEFCFLYPRESPGEVYRALLDCADYGASDLGSGEALEVIEGMVVRGLRRL